MGHLPLLAPSSRWNGTAGSGFSIIPTDPARTTAKPVLRLIVPPNQYFTDELLVGVMAGANHDGSLAANMGLMHVVVHCEGNSRNIDSPSFQTFADANGTYRTYFGWWTLLRHNGRNGHAQVYFEAIPSDPTMQPRVIGPYQFSPQNNLHDLTMTVAASGAADFVTIGDALAHCRTTGLNNPLVTIIEAGDYDIADGAQAYEGQGYCTIAAATGGVRIARPGYTSDAASVVRPRYAGLKFSGANLTIDMRYISEIHSEPGATRLHWMDGCTIVNSAGQGALWRGITRPLDWIVRDGGWFTECQVENCRDPFTHAKLVRGTSELNGTRGLYVGCSTVIGNVSTGHRTDTSTASDIPALSVRYAGAAATATIELAGVNSAASRTVTVKIAGNPDRTFALDKSEAAYLAGTNYTLKNLVDWLNTIAGITATQLDTGSGRAAAWLSLAGLSGGPFTARDIKASPLTLVTFIDVRSDWWQEGALTENIVVWGNVATSLVATSLNLGGTGPKRDVLIANNAIQNDKTAPQSGPLSSRFDGANSHVVCVHNTLSTQNVIFATNSVYTSNSYDLFANNSVRAIAWGGAAAATAITNNHIHAGGTAPISAPGQGNVSGTSIGGDDTSLYYNDRSADFRAIGQLATALVAPVLEFNADGESFDPLDVKGAYRVALQAPLVTASSVSQYGITFTFSEARPVAQYPTGDWRVLGPVTITSITPASTQVSGDYLEGNTYPLSWAHGAQLNPGNRSWAPGGLAVNNKDNQPQGLNGVPPMPGNGYNGTAYRHQDNQDPGATGQPLTITTGSLMKFVSRDGQGGRGKPYQASRPGGIDMAVLTVVDDMGVAKAMRPGVAQADKSHRFTTDDWDLSVFNNFPKTPSTPSATTAIANVQRAFACQFTDSVNSENAHAFNNHPSYGREIAEKVYDSLLCLHLDFTPSEKIDILNGLYGQMIDHIERLLEGGDCVIPAGGGNSWKKAAALVVRMALRNSPNAAKLAEIDTLLDANRSWLWAEDKQIREVSYEVINTPRGSSSSRPLDPYVLWMEGTVDFTSGATVPQGLNSGGSNYTAPYRINFTHKACAGMLAALLIPGAKSLWNRDVVFEYYKTVVDIWRRLGQVGAAGVHGGEGSSASNYFSTFHREMIGAYWPSDPAAPALAAAKVDGNTLWLRFDKTLDEGALVPLSDYTVKINGIPVAGIARPVVPLGPHSDGTVWVPNGIFRTNVGLVLPNAVRASDVVTISYAGGSGANKLRSTVDYVNVAAFADQAVQNVTPAIGGVNAAYPIVRFDSTRRDQYKTAMGAKWGANSPFVTVWIPKFRLISVPANPGVTTFFGVAGFSPPFEIEVRWDRNVRFNMRTVSNVLLRPQIQLALDTEYNILFTADVSQTSLAAGVSMFINGSTATPNHVGSWTGGAGQQIKWDADNLVWELGGGEAGQYFNGEMGGIWMFPGVRVTNSAQIAKFTSLTNGGLDVGTLGEGITGTSPPVFIVGNAGQYNDPAGINRGTGPKLFRTNGGAADVGTVQSNSWS